MHTTQCFRSWSDDIRVHIPTKSRQTQGEKSWTWENLLQNTDDILYRGGITDFIWLVVSSDESPYLNCGDFARREEAIFCSSGAELLRLRYHWYSGEKAACSFLSRILHSPQPPTPLCIYFLSLSLALALFSLHLFHGPVAGWECYQGRMPVHHRCAQALCPAAPHPPPPKCCITAWRMASYQVFKVRSHSICPRIRGVRSSGSMNGESGRQSVQLSLSRSLSRFPSSPFSLSSKPTLHGKSGVGVRPQQALGKIRCVLYMSYLLDSFPPASVYTTTTGCEESLLPSHMCSKCGVSLKSLMSFKKCSSFFTT